MLGVSDEPENSSPDLAKTHEGRLDGDAVENIPGRRNIWSSDVWGI